ncbi:MAG: isoaspartyl peptidase/L-asparaginase [Thermoguttaceae bacterium]|jgi:beta-aspartyl-peptidase (threonine type)
MNHTFTIFSLAVYCLASTCSADDTAEQVVLAVHGGAGVLAKELMTPKKAEAYRQVLEKALHAGHAQLQNGRATSRDAVVAAIRIFEDSPLFNAGKGAAFTREGRNELDAAIMDGRTRQAGAVAGVTIVKNPIVAARLVMEKSPHVLLCGQGADIFAREFGAEIVDPSYFYTDERWKLLEDELRGQKIKLPPKPTPQSPTNPQSGLPAASRFGTVGCVSLDRHGNLTAGTSTGGLTAKFSGRVGDSPLIGAGTFADNQSCAVSATGDGEYFIRAVAAHDIAALVEYKGLTVAQASRIVVHDKIKRAGGEGGVIVLDRHGNLAMTYSSVGMYRGYVTSSGKIRVMIYTD